MAIESGNQVQDGGLPATGWTEQASKGTLPHFKTDIVQHAQPFAASQHMVLADVVQSYRAHCSSGLSPRHRVRRFSIGLNRKYSMANMTSKNKNVQAKT